MNSNLTKFPAILLTGLLLMLTLFSCKKDPYEIGISLLPPTDTLNLKTTDTCTVQAFSAKQDSIRTDKPSSLIIGSMLDPVFGKITSSVYTQLLLESEGVDFGTNPVLDSLVLMLSYDGHYGDTLTRQNFKVYEISQDFSYDSIYYSNKKLDTYPTLLADQDFIPRLKDSVSLYGVKVAPHLRINLNKLTNYLGNKILSAPASALATNVSFLSFIKGLYIQATPVNGKGALLDFSLSDGMSRVVAYYHNGNDPTDDSLHYNLLINTSSGRFLHVDHNGYLDGNQALRQQVINHDSAQGSKQLFLQGMAGVKIKVKFPFMKNFSLGKKVAINEALLELKNYETDTTYSPPVSLVMFRQDSIGRISYMIDENEGANSFGGSYNKTTRSYYFRLTQYMQKVLQNAYSNHYDLYIVVDDPIKSIPTPNRVSLNGTSPLVPGGNADRLHLKVTYTILH